jgi:hypothetical protein
MQIYLAYGNLRHINSGKGYYEWTGYI